MSFPLGDHTGFADTESIRRTGAPPSAGTLYTRVLAPSFAATVIHWPSGDHDAAPRTSSDSATAVAVRPSDEIHVNVERPRARTGKQTRWPSGDTAPAAAISPMGARHNSTAFPSESRHTASAPPRDARYITEPS